MAAEPAVPAAGGVPDADDWPDGEAGPKEECEAKEECDPDEAGVEAGAGFAGEGPDEGAPEAAEGWELFLSFGCARVPVLLTTVLAALLSLRALASASCTGSAAATAAEPGWAASGPVTGCVAAGWTAT